MSGSSAQTIAADPEVQVNPLAAMNAGVSAAKNVYDLREKQANEAIGNILQQSTDAQGNVDYGTANALAAKAGPRVQMGMQTMLAANSARRGEQIDQGQAINTNITRAGVSLMRDPSDANVNATFDNLISTNPGQRQMYEAERQRVLAMQDPKQRQDYSYQHVVGQLSAADQFISQLGQTTLQDFGGYKGPVNLRQPTPSSPGGTSQPPGGAVMTMTPEQLNTTIELPDPRKTLPDGSPNQEYAKPKTFTRREQLEMNGFVVLPNGQVIPPGGNPTGASGSSPLGSGRYNVPPALRNSNAPPAPNAAPAPNAPAAPGTIQFGNPNQPQAVPAPPGSSAPAGPYTGGGMGTILGPRSDAAPAPNANVAAILQGMQTARANPLGGSAMTAGPGAPTTPTVAATPEAGWGTAPGTYDATPAVPVARPAATPPPAQRSPFDRPVMGLSEADREQVKAAGPKFDAETAAGTNAQAQQALLGNMLVDTKQFLPGPWAETWKNIRARLAPAFNVNETALAGAENFDKGMAQLANAQGAGSDARMSVNIAANPHGGMSAPGVDLALRQLQGNADYLQARARLAQQWEPKADYNSFASSIRQLDPRVFQYERMTGGQRSDYLDALSPKDARAFMAAHKWAEGKGLLSR